MSAPKQAPRYNIQHIQLEVLEALVYRRAHDEAGKALMEAFRRLRTGAEFVGLPYHLEEVRPQYFARLAAAITALIVDPGFTFSDEGYAKMLIEHAAIDAIYDVSAFGSSDHLARLLSEDPAERDPSKMTFSNENLAKWLLMHSVDSSIDVDYDQLFGSSKDVAAMFFPLWSAMLGQPVILTERAHLRREQLAKLAHYFKDMDSVPDVSVAPLSDAYMNASYCTADDKHELKRGICSLLGKTLTNNMKNLPTPGDIAVRRNHAKLNKKPTMVIPLEHFSSFHAMYRCYAPVMRQLRSRFRMIAVSRAGALDDKSRKEFSDVIPLPEGQLSYAAIIDQINKVKPDIIYYPSIGMALQWVGLSCVRLAPIQVLTLGHPATTMSPAMDYCVAEEAVVASASRFSERVVITPDGAMAFERRPDIPPRRKEVRHDQLDDKMVIDVAVSAMVLKLNFPFLQTLKRISDRAASSVAVRYHFFPAQLGVTYWQAKKHLRDLFPNCEVHPRIDYPEYMHLLGTCDVSLCPFPFGGTNSSVDSVWLGVPTLMLMGDEPHSRSDYQILGRLGLESCITHSVEQYENRAVELIKDKFERMGITAFLEDVDIESELFGEPKGIAADAYGKAFEYIFENHERLQQSPRGIHHWKEYIK